MEEDIDIIEDFLDRSSYLMHTTTKEDLRELQVYMSKNDYKAIENLIARYKEIEKYKKYYENEKVIWNRKDYIPKSKVKEKIEELEKVYRKEKINQNQPICWAYEQYNYGKKVLQKLLED